MRPCIIYGPRWFGRCELHCGRAYKARATPFFLSEITIRPDTSSISIWTTDFKHSNYSQISKSSSQTRSLTYSTIEKCTPTFIEMADELMASLRLETKSNDYQYLISRVKDLPVELRLKTFRNDIQKSIAEDVRFMDKPPPLLVSLESLQDCKEDSHLYTEALNEYNIINPHINKDNIKDFNKRSIVTLLKIKHLTIRFPLTFPAQKLTLMNELETVFLYCTVDFFTRPKENGEDKEYASSGAWKIAKLLLTTNQHISRRPTMRRIVVKTDLEYFRGFGVLHHIASGLGFEPMERIRIRSYHEEDGGVPQFSWRWPRDTFYYVWEHDFERSPNCLTWSEDGWKRGLERLIPGTTYF